MLLLIRVYRMAGKIVHMKREPITLHDRQWLAQCDYLVGESDQRLLNADGKFIYGVDMHCFMDNTS